MHIRSSCFIFWVFRIKENVGAKALGTVLLSLFIFAFAFYLLDNRHVGCVLISCALAL